MRRSGDKRRRPCAKTGGQCHTQQWAVAIMLEIWGRRNSINVQKVMWTVAELDLDHERHDAGMQFGVVDTDAFAALNPNRKVPVVKDGDLVLWESNAIVRYLAAKYGNEAFWPRDPGERALLDRWMDWTAITAMRSITPLFWGLIRTRPEDRDETALSAAVKDAGETFAILDKALEGRKFLGGEAPGFGEIPIGVTTYRYHSLPVERPALPNVTRWYERLQEREAFREHVMIPLS